MLEHHRRWPRLTALCTLVLLVGVAGCDNLKSPVNPSDYGIEWSDLTVGNGTEARVGRGLSVFYSLWLYDAAQPGGKGTFVETNVGGQQFSFVLGAGQVISGWDIGLQGMRAGGTRRLVVPPEHAYGSQEREKIPANSTLLFEVQLTGVF